MLPKIYLVGPRKTATTTLYELFKKSDVISVVESVKEIHYFDKFYDKGISWYEGFYKGMAGTLVEVSPSYFDKQNIPNRISEITKPKIVITLRDPLERCISDYLHHLRYGHTRARILDAIKEYPTIIESSRYSLNIERWRESFGQDNVLIMYSLQNEEIESLEKFIGVKIGSEIDQILRENEGGHYGNYFVTKIVSKLTLLLRSFKLNGTIEYLKKKGLKEKLYKTKKIDKDDLIDEDEKNILTEELKDEILKYNSRKF